MSNMPPMTTTSPMAPRNKTTIPNTCVVQSLTAGSAGSLWEKAVEALDDEEKGDVNFKREDKLAILEDVLKAVDEKKKICLQKRWKYKKGGKEIIIRDELEKVSEWVNGFKEVGDFAVQYDTAHAALPWAGVKFLLQVTVNDSQAFGAMVVGIELISNLITRYTIFEELYLRPTIVWENADELKGQLTQAIIKLYITILKYLSRARRYFGRTTAERLLGSAAHTVESNLHDYIAKIEKEKDLVDECARLIDAARMLDSSVAIGRTTAIDTTRGVETLLQRPARYEDPLTHRSDSDEPAHVVPSLGQPLLPVPHCKMCNILFYLWVSLAATSLAVGLWRSLATSDEGKGFTDAAYVIAVGGLVIYPIQNRHALRCPLNKK